MIWKEIKKAKLKRNSVIKNDHHQEKNYKKRKKKIFGEIKLHF